MAQGLGISPKLSYRNFGPGFLCVQSTNVYFFMKENKRYSAVFALAQKCKSMVNSGSESSNPTNLGLTQKTPAVPRSRNIAKNQLWGFRARICRCSEQANHSLLSALLGVLYMSSLKCYIHALGGQVEIDGDMGCKAKQVTREALMS